MTNEQIVAEMQWTIEAVKYLAGVSPTYMRPSYGDIDDRVRAVLKAMGLNVIIWNYDSNDWRLNSYPGGDTAGVTPDTVRQQCYAWGSNPSSQGILSLQHDAFQWSAYAAPGCMDAARDKRFNVVTVSNCVGGPPPYSDGSSTDDDNDNDHR
ncbi:chitin deacetylase [Chytridiales sp. JEL 0842]|nr:chitin deacetylase [Chytridiales sp. JEL 0842]